MTPDEHAIRDLVALWRRATVAGDVDTVLHLMSDDMLPPMSPDDERPARGVAR